ncbi:methionyl-tRNA formyltransferase [Comamonas sp. UBA7528]|uniref:methionyl-tRNA formyltransferase n=1 Tax=Comamonas sp. UBA7528 TaxID=1946391 RepID=UPI0025BECDCC|nr:methionyl-tRNA formyltransferase [Comamonas sp. UBA7528]
MKVIFAGTPDFARVALERLLAAGFDVPLVLTQPDRPAGRGMKLQASPVKQCALEHGIRVEQPRSLRLDGKYPEDAAAARQALLDACADVMVVAAYGLILPQWVLDLPPRGCLNIHASLLPRWRGAAPIHRAIEAGDTETGVTIMQMDIGLDTGDMCVLERLPIAQDDTTGSLHDKLATLGGRLIVEALEMSACGGLHRTPQPAEGVTYAHKIEKAESAMDWRLSASVLDRRLRAFSPFPGGSTQLGEETIKLWAAVPEDFDGSAQPGQVLAADAQGVLVACGEGALRLTQLQRAGGKKLAAADFLRGFELPVGSQLQLPHLPEQP